MNGEKIIDTLHARAKRMERNTAYAIGAAVQPKPDNPHKYGTAIHTKSPRAPIATCAKVAASMDLSLVIVDAKNHKHAIGTVCNDLLPGATEDDNVAKAIEYLAVALDAYQRDLRELAA